MVKFVGQFCTILRDCILHDIQRQLVEEDLFASSDGGHKSCFN